MRAFWLMGTVAVLLAGCATSKSGETGEGQVAQGSASQAASPAPPASGHVHVQSDSIPAAFHGVYDESLQACTRPGVQRLTVSARELRFHESVGAVRAVTSAGSVAIQVEADYVGEGERWRSLLVLALAEGGARLRVSGTGTPFDRVRCPKGAR